MELGRIGVLMGGPSAEREISFKSGHAVYDALKGRGLQVRALEIVSDDISENKDFLRSAGIDCAFIALHGYFGEDGKIQSILESLNIPYTGSGPKASSLAIDKIASREIFSLNGLCVPKHINLRKSELRKGWQAAGLDYPLVVKPAAQGSSIGMSLVMDALALDDALGKAFTFGPSVIIEQHIKGREMTVGILQDTPLPVVEIIPKHDYFDFSAKYQAGLTDYVVPAKIGAELSRKVSEAGLSAHRLLGCEGFSRADIIVNENGEPVVLEVNTIPGLTSTSLLPKAAKAKGIEFSELCLALLRFAYERENAQETV